MTPFLKDHLSTGPYKLDPQTQFKNLLRPRHQSAEKFNRMNFTTNDWKRQVKADREALDSSFKDTGMLFYPNFR